MIPRYLQSLFCYGDVTEDEEDLPTAIEFFQGYHSRREAEFQRIKIDLDSVFLPTLKKRLGDWMRNTITLEFTHPIYVHDALQDMIKPYVEESVKKWLQDYNVEHLLVSCTKVYIKFKDRPDTRPLAVPVPVLAAVRREPRIPVYPPRPRGNGNDYSVLSDDGSRASQLGQKTVTARVSPDSGTTTCNIEGNRETEPLLPHERLERNRWFYGYFCPRF